MHLRVAQGLEVLRLTLLGSLSARLTHVRQKQRRRPLERRREHRMVKRLYQRMLDGIGLGGL